MKTRSKWEITLDILKEIQEEEKVKKTRIMHRANLDWKSFQRHMDFLLDEGFMARCNPITDYYELTGKGRNLLQKLKEVGELMRESSPQYQYPGKN